MVRETRNRHKIYLNDNRMTQFLNLRVRQQLKQNGERKEAEVRRASINRHPILNSVSLKEKVKKIEMLSLVTVEITKSLEQMIQTLNKLSSQVIIVLIKTEETYKEDDRLAVAVIAKIKKKVKIFYTERESEVILKKKMTQ